MMLDFDIDHVRRFCDDSKKDGSTGYFAESDVKGHTGAA